MLTQLPTIAVAESIISILILEISTVPLDGDKIFPNSSHLSLMDKGNYGTKQLSTIKKVDTVVSFAYV